jgi:hypothetical protein
MVQSYPEGFSKRFRPPDPSEKCGMDSWLIFSSSKNHQSLSWVANYETQAIRVNHLSALQNYLAELDTAPPVPPPEAAGGPEKKAI